VQIETEKEKRKRMEGRNKTLVALSVGMDSYVVLLLGANLQRH